MESSFWQLLNDYRIEIPILQRDYAQGRQLGKVPTIRKKFLNTISESFNTKKPLKLDFVYGYTRNYEDSKQIKVRSFVPLDGQQRLTTLFLWHWYVAAIEDKSNDAREHLSKFTYETRHSSRVFCSELVKYKPLDFVTRISETIKNQPWFFAAWKNDPTISSMLVVLDEIQAVIKTDNLTNLWPILTTESHIVFQILKMEELGLPDDLYIKMNSRGKELTEFEHFKSRFSELLDNNSASFFNKNIDQKWSDLFWDIWKKEDDSDIAKMVDESFLRFFRFVSDMLIYRNNLNVKIDHFDLATYFPIYQDKKNVEFFFKCLEVLTSLYNTNPEFFFSVFYTQESDFSADKVRLFFNSAEPDLFVKCIKCYDSDSNQFSIGEQLLLYSSLLHLIRKTIDFSPRVRTVRNLLANSGDEVRKSNMYSLMITVEDIIITNTVDPNAKFNTNQVNEEFQKQTFFLKNPGLKSSIYKLEDHYLLQGCTAAFWTNSIFNDFTDNFYRLFPENCDFELVDKGLLTIGDYTQEFGKWFTQLGKNSTMWRELLTPSNKKHRFDGTKSVLISALSQGNFDSALAVSRYLGNNASPKDWRFYFLKYPDFWKSKYGFYYWDENKSNYECMMMNASTLGGFHWCPYLTAIKNNSDGNLSLEGYGAPLVYVKDSSTLKIVTVASGFKIVATNKDGELLLDKIRKKSWIDKDDICTVSQNKDGIDLEDRIEKGLELISNINTLK